MKKSLLIITIAAGLLAGCKSTCRTFSMSDMQSRNYVNRHVGEGSNSIGITDIVTRPVNDLTQAEINLHNYNDKTQNISYEVIWFDKNGTQVNKDPNILIAEIDGKANKQVSVLAPNPTAVTLEVKVCYQS
jgi:uncharacterized protein YcfL